MWRSVLVAFVVFGPMLVEASRARRNEQARRAAGGVEPSGDVYSWMQIAYPGLLLAMILEGGTRGLPPRAWIATGAAVFVAAKLLKWWAIHSLGASWTFRVIVVPGAPLVTTGPYRYVSHPNYIAVAGEFVGVALVSGARLSGPVALLLFGALMLRRVAVENRALESASGL